MNRALILILCSILFASCSNEDDRKAFMQQLQTKADTLMIDNTKDTMITGAKGTAIFFEKESFVMPEGSLAKGNITIKLKECYSLADMMRENLSTTSGGQLLESGGMVEVTAFAGGQELQLKDGKKFIVHFPKDTSAAKKTMNLFYAARTESGVMDWTLDTATLLKPKVYLGQHALDRMFGGNGYMRFKGQIVDGSEGSYYNMDSLYNYFFQNFDVKKLRSPQSEINKVY